jgi:hypothetical protein
MIFIETFKAVRNGLTISVKQPRAARLLIALSLTAGAFGQDAGNDQTRSISLTVPAGVPLRLYLTKRVSKRLNAPVEAKLLTPVYAFDHEVIPAGTPVFGHVSELVPVSNWTRFRAIMGGDFTPLHIAEIEFTSMRPAGGDAIELHTIASPGLSSLVSLIPPKTRPSQNAQSDGGGVVATAKQTAKDTVNAQIERIKGIPDLVRAPGKKEWLYDYAMSRLPYHPQYIRSRTRFDAELDSPLAFGSETVTQDSLTLLGSQPPQGSVVHARLLTPLHSARSTAGENVEAVLEEPLFSADSKVVLPEGTLVTGAVAMTKRARWFHRGGRLRFAFQNIDLSPQTLALMETPAGTPLQSQSTAPSPDKLQFATRGILSAAEGGNASIKVDKEGGVQATESKTRFIGTAVAAMVLRRAADNDALHGSGGQITGQSRNIGGRTLGGGMGFGILGAIAAQSSRTVGTAFGYYGLAWSLFSTVVARGKEVEFDKNAVINIGFNQRTVGDPAKLDDAAPSK